MPFRRTSIDSSQRTGFYSPKRSRVVGGGVFSFDSDALTYITAVEAADGEVLEFSVKKAYNAFVVGCKSDGIWSAIKASCIMAGARTLSGALVPLVGVAPSGFNLASGEYSRAGGLKGDGVSMYLDSNRLHTTDPQNSFHMSVFASFISSTNSAFMGTDSVSETGSSFMGGGTSNNFFTRNRSSTGTASAGGPPVVGFLGNNRVASGSYTQRTGNTNYTVSVTSQTPYNSNVYVYRRGSAAPFYSLHRLSFYSIGESLDLALLDNRVTVLMSGIQNAIP